MRTKQRRKKTKKLFGMKNLMRFSRYWKIILWSIVIVLLITEFGGELMGIL